MEQEKAADTPVTTTTRAMIARPAFLLLLSTALAIAQVPLEEYSTNSCDPRPHARPRHRHQRAKSGPARTARGSSRSAMAQNVERLDQTSAEVLPPPLTTTPLHSPSPG
jgi:hypothetical protein